MSRRETPAAAPPAPLGAENVRRVVGNEQYAAIVNSSHNMYIYIYICIYIYISVYSYIYLIYNNIAPSAPRCPPCRRRRWALPGTPSRRRGRMYTMLVLSLLLLLLLVLVVVVKCYVVMWLLYLLVVSNIIMVSSGGAEGGGRRGRPRGSAP